MMDALTSSGLPRPLSNRLAAMADALTFSISSTDFNQDYTPAESSRITTNFANLARGENRRENLGNALTMIDRRLNSLMHWDNPDGERFTLQLEIISANVHFDSAQGAQDFPLLEVLNTSILDRYTGTSTHGIVGNTFSSMCTH